jgi:broad-specificity NMP kinase
VGLRNYLVEGVSASGKTSVCRELTQRGYHAINGDRELAYQGDPQTGDPTDTADTADTADHEHHIWNVDLVRAIAADSHESATFFCGGSRNFRKFLDVFDEVFVLDIDSHTLHHRLDQRSPDEWGAKPSERDLIVRLHESREDIPDAGVVIDATRPLADVVDDILRHAGEALANR